MKNTRNYNQKNYLSKKKETIWIKKLKLSYYDEVDDNLKQLYLNYYKEMFSLFKEKYEKASNEEKNKLLKKAISNASQYRDKFIESQMYLVYSFTNTEQTIYNNMDDLYQEGITGLLIALKKFDIKHNVKFSTYANWWIKKYIYEYIENTTNIIKIPKYI